jgi:hypothetical protein
MTTAAAAEPRIHELLLENLFAVFGERDPERRLEAIARNYTEDQPRGAGAAAGGQRHRRGLRPRWTDRRVAYALDGPGLTKGRIQE